MTEEESTSLPINVMPAKAGIHASFKSCRDGCAFAAAAEKQARQP